MPILTLLHLAKLKGWTPQLLDYRNSGDTAGDKSRVVGYCAVAFTSGAGKTTSGQAPPAPPPAAQFNPAERQFLLGLARRTLTRVTAGHDLPEIKSDTVPAPCRAAKGCFVTLTESGELRGCIGNILPAGPLYQAIMDNTRSAALRDPRFPPVTAEEAAQVHLEISVLTVPEPLAFASPDDLLARLQPHRDGVVLQIGGRRATFLPQVWEQLPDKAEFLSHLAAKAGCPPSAWRGKDVSVSLYRAEAFQEPK
jgi:AmmeMemoRadiSam system protein A